MHVDIVLLPRDLRPEHLDGRIVVVFDVLRATTTMTAALAAGVQEIRIFDSIEAASTAKKDFERGLLCGERQCLPPPGFDLGNSPGAFNPEVHRERTLLMATTNGTRAIVAAKGAKHLLIGALVNAAAVAARVRDLCCDLTLLCAGTQGQPALEDILGAGAVINELEALASSITPGDDMVRAAIRLFRATSMELRTVLSDAAGGRNVNAAKLPQDIDFAARLNSLNVVGEVLNDPLRVVPVKVA